MSARVFWRGVLDELTGAGEQRRTAARHRAQGFIDAASVLECIAGTQAGFDDAEMQEAARHTVDCARALRAYAANLTTTPTADTARP
jgi:hypothetical protein